MEPYRDDDDDNHGGDQQPHLPQERYTDGDEEDREEIFVDDDEVVPPPRMKPMSVETTVGFNPRTGRAQRMACFAAFLSVCFLMAGYWISQNHEFQTTNGYPFSQEPDDAPFNNDTAIEEALAAAAARGGSENNEETTTAPKENESIQNADGHHDNQNNNNDDDGDDGKDESAPSDSPNEQPECENMDANYFQDLMARVRNTSLPLLCQGRQVQTCACPNPFLADEDGNPEWEDAMQDNVALMQQSYLKKGIQPEVVIYGDDFAELLLGRIKGLETNPEIAQVTEELLTKEGGGQINALPMGIAGDTTSNLLHRLNNGAMPKDLRPKVIWLIIGDNNIPIGCNVDVVVAGTIRVVREIRKLLGDHQIPIVLNSHFPFGSANLLLNGSSLLRREINEKLKCYSMATKEVHFGDITGIMTESKEEGLFLKQDYFLKDFRHPSAKGVREWEEFIVSRVQQLIS